jgi:DNA-binding transcriptional ArsR family regulator
MVQKYTYLEPYLEDPSKQINLQEFEGVFNTPHQTVRRHLQAFVEEKILTEQKQGKFVFYKLNLDNPLLLSYLSICEKERTINFLKNPLFKRLHELLSPHFAKASFLMFGSAVLQKSYKDIDLLVMPEYKTVKKSIADFESTYVKKLHIVMTNETHLSKALKKEITKKHIILNNHDYFVRLLYGKTQD